MTVNSLNISLLPPTSENCYCAITQCGDCTDRPSATQICIVAVIWGKKGHVCEKNMQENKVTIQSQIGLVSVKWDFYIPGPSGTFPAL